MAYWSCILSNPENNTNLGPTQDGVFAGVVRMVLRGDLQYGWDRTRVRFNAMPDHFRNLEQRSEHIQGILQCHHAFKQHSTVHSFIYLENGGKAAFSSSHTDIQTTNQSLDT